VRMVGLAKMAVLTIITFLEARSWMCLWFEAVVWFNPTKNNK
jgi:uncharacterized protein YggT (Ycf19 family)